jgi:hypothetical protein
MVRAPDVASEALGEVVIMMMSRILVSPFVGKLSERFLELFDVTVVHRALRTENFNTVSNTCDVNVVEVFVFLLDFSIQ